MRTLVFRPGGLGDLLLALPSLHALKSGQPARALDVAGNAAFVPVLRLSPDVEAGHDFGARLFTGLFCTGAPPEEELTRFLARFDRAALLLSDPGGLIRMRLRACGLLVVDGGTLEPRPSTPPHLTERLAALAGLETFTLEGLPRALLDSSRLPEAPAFHPAKVTLHPGAGGHGKCWPLSAYARLGLELARRGCSLRALSGPAEEGLAAELAARWDRERTRGCRPKGRQEPAQAVRAGPSTGGPGQSASGPLFSEPSSSLELARELAGAALHVGNDSGPTHLAAALGTPTIAIHGPTDPAVWAPRGRHVQALAPRPGSAWPEPDEVLEAALRLLEMET